jgi:phage tail-like protein
MVHDDGSEQSSSGWPTPKFYFEVDFGDGAGSVPFQEVSGLDTEVQTIEYRKTNNPEFSTIKMPGIKKLSNVTLKKGVFVNDNKFWDWYKQIKTNAISRKTVTIKLLDEEGKPTMVWQLTNCWPTKVTSTDLKSSGNEVAIESIELAHEGLTISNES